MQPEISEFSFGYAFLESFIRSLPAGLSAAPLFPTQRQEGQSGGYDVALSSHGRIIYFQFKRAERLYSIRGACRGHGFSTLYRMHLYAKNNFRQHSLMSELETSGSDIYYCAPRFSENRELDYAYTSGHVLRDSVLIAPSSIGVLTGKQQHYVCYDNRGNEGWLHSSPVKCVVTDGDAMLKSIDQKRFEMLKVQLYKEYRNLSAIVRPGSAFGRVDSLTEEPADIDTVMKRVAHYSKILLNCECLLVWRNEE